MIVDRMDKALAALDLAYHGKRKPKAFYLGPADWLDFEATDPGDVVAIFNHEERTEPGYRGVAVRASKNVAPHQSSLYDETGHGRPLPPFDGKRPERSPRSDIPAEDVFAALDTISRTRALSETESRALEAAMKGRVVISKRDAARMGIKRRAA